MTHFFGTDTKIYKMVLLGDPSVGKTSLRKRYLGTGFDGNYVPTIGADFAIKLLKNKAVQIWDLAGHSIFKNVRIEFYRGAQGALIIFDLTSKKSLQNVSKWLDELYRVTSVHIPFVLVGNKADLRDGDIEMINSGEAKNVIDTLQKISNFETTYVESSALTGFNVDEIFSNLLSKIDERR